MGRKRERVPACRVCTQVQQLVEHLLGLRVPGASQGSAHGDLLLRLLGSFGFQGVGSGLDLSPAVKKAGFRFRGFGVQTAALITPVARHSNP